MCRVARAAATLARRDPLFTSSCTVHRTVPSQARMVGEGRPLSGWFSELVGRELADEAFGEGIPHECDDGSHRGLDEVAGAARSWQVGGHGEVDE